MRKRVNNLVDKLLKMDGSYMLVTHIGDVAVEFDVSKHRGDKWVYVNMTRSGLQAFSGSIDLEDKDKITEYMIKQLQVFDEWESTNNGTEEV